MAGAVPLSSRRVIELEPTPPFHFDSTLHNPDHFPSADNEWQPGVRWQTMRFDDHVLGLKFEDLGSVDAPRIRLSVSSAADLAEASFARLLDEIEYRSNLKLDLTAFYRRFADDPQLKPIIKRWCGMRPFNHSSLYEYLIIAIVLQNATVRRTVQMMQALFETYGTLVEYDGKQLYAYWPPTRLAAASEDELRALKVGYRARSLRRVSETFAEGEIEEQQLRTAPIEDQRRVLLGLYGVGPASVGYILAGVFHQLDEMNHISPWEQRIYSKLFLDRDANNPAPVEDLRRLFDERFAGWRMLAVHYIWEDLFWLRQHSHVPWLEKLIRL